ncbi:PLP-dependent cysteine synthase family protein [Geothrix sp. PMB-07]|uniref:PLP-dependent cysteine synthase family protein n=1 Tax=Geothrix sp. PMB-07 TaxID=3068640 RepID=UPI00274094A2|nr:cysteine synthase family protein [Geothrix sp. PMB-07]WLT33160.1 cysteine synthase family protein [Geothrix sp. PMB-07]
MTDVQSTFRTLNRLVGFTPLLALDVLYKGEPRRIYAKAENFNFTGSIKDRMALHILRRAHASGKLRPGAAIGEATSGNTGISFSALGRALNHPVTIFMPDWMNQERKDLIRSFGAEVRLVSAAEGGFLGSIRLSEEWADRTPDAFLPRQFANDANVEAHATTTGPEIWAQLGSQGLRPQAFVAGVGTGGTVMGVGRFLKAQNPAIQVHPVEPSNSPTLHTGHKVGKHRIQGISDEFIPAIVQLDQLDDILSVDDGDAILMAQKLASRGLGVGISSGANFLAALQAQDRLGRDAVVVTVFSDSNKKYLSTDLMKEEPAKDGFLSPQIELIGLGHSIRVCELCIQGKHAAGCGC